MAEGGEQYGEDGERERSMWIQQAARPNWFQAAVNGDGKGDGDGGKQEAEEDSGLELSLGLSLGSRSSGSKGKAGGAPKEEKGKDGSKPEPAGKMAGEGKEILAPAGPGFESWRHQQQHQLQQQQQHQQQQQQQQLQQQQQQQLQQQQLQQQQQSQPQASDEEMRMAMHHIAAMHALQHQQQQQQGKEDAASPAPFFQDLQQNAAAAMVINNAVVWARLAQAQQQMAGSAPAAAPGPGMVLQPSGPSGSFLPLQRQQSGLGPEIAEAGLDPRLEQQRLKSQAQAQRRQEARKKRKIQQEQKLQKKAKKEEEAPRGGKPQQLGRASTPPPLKTASSLPSNCKEVSSPPDSQEGAASASVSAGSAGSGGGFRRMGSGSWPAAAAGEQEEGGEQMQELKRALHIYGKERKEKEADAASSVHLQRLKAEEAVRPLPAAEGGQGPAGVSMPVPVPAPGPAPGAPLNVIDFARLSQEGWFQKLMEMQMMNPGLPQAAVAFMQEHGVGPVPMPVPEHGQRRREPLERTSSVEHERVGSNAGENGGDRKGSPMRYDGRNVDKVASLPAAAQYPGMPGMPGVPPGFPPANFMHMPYPFPIPIPPNAAGFPFPFPYLLQPGPAPGGGDVRPMPVTSGGPYQLLVTPPGFAPFLPSPEMGNPWPQVVRPQAAAVAPVASVSPPRSIVRTTSGMSEDDAGRNQGSKSSDKSRSRASSPSEEERSGNAPRVGPPTGAVRPVGAFAPMRNGPVPGFSVPPQFGLPRNISEGGERLLPREGSVGSAFASLSMTSEPMEAGEGKPPQNKAPAQNGVKVERAQPRALGEGSGQEELAGSVVTQLETAGADASNAEELERAGAAAAQQPSSEANNSAPAAGSAVTGNASVTAPPSAERGNPENISSKIAPGIAPGETFGGTGQIPALPWVQCTGAGPNGKTICGALYSCQKVIRIVCKCHGNHMSPADFVKHAGGADTSNPEKFITVSHYTIPTQAAIAHG